MRKISCLAGAVALCVALAICCGHFAGCEAAKGVNGLSVTLTPASVYLTPSPTNPGESPIADQVQFTASLQSNLTWSADSTVLALPLKWSVSDPSLGTIACSSGWTALYQPTGNPGQNIITVVDQYGDEGNAMVTQMAAGTTVSTNSTPTTTSSTTTTTT